MLDRGFADNRAVRPRGQRLLSAGDQAYRALARYARATDMPLAARANAGRREKRLQQIAAKTPRSPAGEQSYARTGPEQAQTSSLGLRWSSLGLRWTHERRFADGDATALLV